MAVAIITGAAPTAVAIITAAVERITLAGSIREVSSPDMRPGPIIPSNISSWAGLLETSLRISSACCFPRPYLLFEALRRLGLSGTEWARAQVGTIRLRLLKVGGVITRNTRRISLRLSFSFPLRQLFCSCLVRFYG
jgi:hypothetical protein